MKKIVKKYTDYFTNHRLKAFMATYAVCIAAALAVNIVTGIVNFGLSTAGVYRQKSLTADDFELVDAEYVDSMTIINATNDTQMIYTGNIKNLVVNCDFSRPPGEFVCFYNSRGDYSFGTHKMKYAKQYGDYYIFEFPYGTKQVRMDTGVEPSITVSFDSIQINSFSAFDMFGFSTSWLFSLLFIPAAVHFGIDTLLKILYVFKKK
ncbi:MAG: hypothetical protein PUE12_14480 [Oscillospiraceae bacterium]|nr:hypothetical protein [Oscillospiraceae bacterium]